MKLKWIAPGLALLAVLVDAATLAAAPANDDLANRQPITLTGTEVVVNGSNQDATLEPGEEWVFHAAGRSVWYSWTPTRSGSVRVEMQTANFGVLPMTGTHVTNVARLPVSAFYWGTSWTCVFEAVAGTNYLLWVDGMEASAPSVGNGPFRFVVSQPLAPPNDQFAQRQDLTGRAVLVRGDTLAATWEPSEPELPLANLQHSLWWNWTAPTSGVATILNSGVATILNHASTESRIAVYTGDNLAALTLVTNNHQPWGAVYSINFPATAGVKYAISLTSPSHERGSMAFFLTLDGAAWLDAPVRNPAGQLEFDFWGLTGETYKLETSSNLKNWQPAGEYYGAYGAARVVLDVPAGGSVFTRMRRP